MTKQATGDAAPPRQDSPYGWWVCAVLCLCFTFSYMDRAVVPLLVGPLQKAFGLSDTGIGLLQGLAFAVFYALFGFPLARVADNGHRRNLILAGLVVWCLATVGCGLARTTPQLFAGRILVAIGEAVLMPAAVSILSDYFSTKARTRALSLYSMGVYFGGGLALALGGALMRAVGPRGAVLWGFGHLETWRLVFVVLGLAGLALVPLLLSVREPVRLSDSGGKALGASSLAELAAEFSRKRGALLAVVLGFATLALGGTTFQAWAPTLFVRQHGWAISHAGQALGLFTIVLGPAGAIVGALLAERLAKAGHSDSKLRVGLLSAGGCCVAGLLATAPWVKVAFSAIVCMQFLIGFNFGLVQASLAELLPNRMRAVASACFVAASNLLAATLGPLLVGVLNDRVFHDPMMIATSIRIVAPSAFALAGVVLMLGLRPYRQALALAAAGRSPAGQPQTSAPAHEARNAS
ncbi:MFS family permease [Caulobacter rhizosphaerae]|uniref:MFS family permease n=1 Tax=Caulobacter rhizosphaerae TaxID=2010972 RepID=A0ABU1MVI9_9CAUL|nr:MFS transporter [Caulobacter rhizosphaerae]MDR6530199.1 MFS family permease [Caulobacter rhizosphaerae]